MSRRVVPGGDGVGGGDGATLQPPIPQRQMHKQERPGQQQEQHNQHKQQPKPLSQRLYQQKL